MGEEAIEGGLEGGITGGAEERGGVDATDGGASGFLVEIGEAGFFNGEGAADERVEPDVFCCPEDLPFIITKAITIETTAPIPTAANNPTGGPPAGAAGVAGAWVAVLV